MTGMHRSPSLVALLALSLPAVSACDGRPDRPRVPSAETTTTEVTTTAPATDPTAGAVGESAEPGAAPSGALPPQARVSIVARHAEHRGSIDSSDAAEHACAIVGARRTIFGAAGAASAIGLSAGHAIAAYVPISNGVDLVVLSVAANGRNPRVLARSPVVPSVRPTQLVPPGIGRIDATHVGVASVDAGRRLVYREFDVESGEASDAIVLASGTADTRFPPAVTSVGELRLVAFTLPGNPMRVEVVVIGSGPRALRRHDVSPDSAGAASPSFVHGANPPLLVFVDPREAFSLSHAIAFDAQGMPGEDDVLQPILGLENPPRLVAALSPRDLELAFLAHGETNQMGTFLLATRASSITPRALVPASDHARLWVDAMGTGYGVVTASLGPRGGVALAEREVVIRLTDAAGLGPDLRISPARGSAIYPALSRDDEGHLAVIFGTGSGIDFAELGCRGVAP